MGNDYSRLEDHWREKKLSSNRCPEPEVNVKEEKSIKILLWVAAGLGISIIAATVWILTK